MEHRYKTQVFKIFEKNKRHIVLEDAVIFNGAVRIVKPISYLNGEKDASWPAAVINWDSDAVFACIKKS